MPLKIILLLPETVDNPSSEYPNMVVCRCLSRVRMTSHPLKRRKNRML